MQKHYNYFVLREVLNKNNIQAINQIWLLNRFYFI